MDWGGLQKGVLARILVRDCFLLLCVLLFPVPRSLSFTAAVPIV